MLTSLIRADFAPPPIARLVAPIVSTMLASLLALLPVVATVPIMPPVGFLTLLAWRLLRPDLIAPWAGILLGLFDDLFSGAALGTGMASWTAALLAIEAIDRRWLFRDAWADWGIAAGLTLAQLLIGWALGGLTGAVPSPMLLVPQWLAATLCFPLIARSAAWLDRRRTRA